MPFVFDSTALFLWELLLLLLLTSVDDECNKISLFFRQRYFGKWRCNNKVNIWRIKNSILRSKYDSIRKRQCRKALINGATTRSVHKVVRSSTITICYKGVAVNVSSSLLKKIYQNARVNTRSNRIVNSEPFYD